MTVEQDFERYLRQGVPPLKERGYNPTYFLRMLSGHGGVGAAHHLLADAADTTYGLDRLWEIGALEATVEFAALLPRFSVLFSDEELATARERLERRDFQVDLWLSKAADEGWGERPA